jgi:hypothetical protein
MNIEEAVTKLIKKTGECEKSEDALRFSQSVANLAHAKATKFNMDKKESP